MTLELPLLPVKIALGRDAKPVPAQTGCTLDSKDIVIVSLAIALLFAVVALIFLAIQK